MADIKLKLKPFGTPNFVLLDAHPGRREDGIKETSSIPLSEVPEEVLVEMCDDFKQEVLRKHRGGG